MQSKQGIIQDPTARGQAFLKRTLVHLGSDPARPLLELASAEYWLMHGERIRTRLVAGADVDTIIDDCARVYGDALAFAMVRAASEVLVARQPLRAA
ncbi:MAG: hypothetical protein KDK91_12015 [Gammaproteobacteria bacterium]|nr:hypothetical protein [Gammaproteobacteria bacterium]